MKIFKRKEDNHPVKIGYNGLGYWWDEDKQGYYNKAGERYNE